MKSRRYTFILVLITLTIITTIGIQIFWNINNYAENKNRLINDVQLAFDNGIENYYTEDARNNYVAFVSDLRTPHSGFVDHVIQDSLLSKEMSGYGKKKKAKVSNISSKISFKHAREEIKIKDIKSIEVRGEPDKNKSDITIIRGKTAVDSVSKMKDLLNKIIISMRNDSIDFPALSASFEKEIKRKNISIDYSIEHIKNDSVLGKIESAKKDFPLKVIGNSPSLQQDTQLKLHFTNPVLQILQRSQVEIILSFLLSMAIIACLLYLLKIINQQKKIDEIKNDLISNITHEFKTPITTVSTAIEGLRHFNDQNDREKTDRYLDISQQQLKKLETIVEKLLETASVDTDKLMLKKENGDLVFLIEKLAEKYRLMAPEKIILFKSNVAELQVDADFFHLENAISNLIDNAIKYGGSTVSVHLASAEKRIEISIQDNGTGIEKSQREKIFEKFYRIPKGNVHDVKGFGIGLFYAKKIVEKHNGKLVLMHNLPTTFKITIYND